MGWPWGVINKWVVTIKGALLFSVHGMDQAVQELAMSSSTNRCFVYTVAIGPAVSSHSVTLGLESGLCLRKGLLPVSLSPEFFQFRWHWAIHVASVSFSCH